MSDVFTINVDPNDLVAVQAAFRAHAQEMCDALNAELKSVYLTAFNNWKISVDAGRIDNSNPPQPPIGYAPVEHAIIPGYTKEMPILGPGWFFPVQGGGPVCEVPPIPPSQLTPKPVLDGSATVIGPRSGTTNFYSCPAADLNPIGATVGVPFPDNTVHVFHLIGTPFGRFWEDLGV